VKQQSLHPPEVRPLLITLNALYGEFLVNGKLGRIRAIDKVWICVNYGHIFFLGPG
jgi:hypothetical protein